jgi:hypothetical protein
MINIITEDYYRAHACYTPSHVILCVLITPDTSKKLFHMLVYVCLALTNVKRFNGDWKRILRYVGAKNGGTR